MPPRSVSLLMLSTLSLVVIASQAYAQELPKAESVHAIKLFTVPDYCEGVVFDHEGNGYISHLKTITKFSLDVLRLTAGGELLEPASKECNGKPLR